MKPFKNVVFSDEDFEIMIKHLEFMEIVRFVGLRSR